MNRRKRPPRNYYWYIALMAVALLLFTSYGLRKEPIHLDFDLKQAKVMPLMVIAPKTEADSLMADSVATDATAATSAAPDPVEALPQKFQWPVDTTDGQRILLIGDSMNEYLRLRLNDYCRENGYDLRCVIWYGATTKQFGSTDTIAYFIRQYKPSYVLLNFGANELFIKDIRTKRQGYVEHILKQIGNLPFVWIGPPNWKEDTGINDLILDNVGEGRYYESRKLTLARYSDGAHPTRTAASNWCDSVAVYLSHDAKVPLRMNVPEQALKKVPKTTILAIEK